MQIRYVLLCFTSLAWFTFGCAGENLMLGNRNSKLTSADSKDDKKSKPTTVKIGGIDWYVDYDAAMKIAKEKKMPLWLHFGENPG